MRELVNILEASLLVAGKPLSLNQIEALFEHESEKPDREKLRNALDLLGESLTTRGIELVEVASGFRLQARQDYAPWVANLMQERAPRYSRALLETLVLIAYRQPITRGEVEDVRGVAVSTNIIRTLLEREWIRVLGHKDVPGRPAIYGTTKQFLDYFNLKRIDELPTLSEIKDLDQIDPDLAKEVALLEAQALAEQGEDTDAAAATDDEPHDNDPANDPDNDSGNDPDNDFGNDPNNDFGNDPGKDLGNEPGNVTDEVSAGDASHDTNSDAVADSDVLADGDGSANSALVNESTEGSPAEQANSQASDDMSSEPTDEVAENTDVAAEITADVSGRGDGSRDAPDAMSNDDPSDSRESVATTTDGQEADVDDNHHDNHDDTALLEQLHAEQGENITVH